jgi:predicted transcriptional regulator
MQVIPSINRYQQEVAMADKVAMAVKLDLKTRERLQALGNARRRSPHWLMCEAIQLYLKREEEEERERALVRERLARYDATGEYVAHEDVEKWLKSWGTDHELPRPPVRVDPEVLKRKKGKR